MEFTAKQIAQLIQAEIIGDEMVKVDRLSKIEEGEEGSLSFLANLKYTPYIYTTAASVVIVGSDFQPDQAVRPTLLKVADAYAAFAKLLAFSQAQLHQKTGISPQAYVSPSATLGEEVYIGEFAYIGDHATIAKGVKIYPQVYIGDRVRVGEGTVLNPGVKVYHDCVLGAHCLLHAGVVVGADGFGFTPNAENQYNKVPQTGNVVVEDHVEIGANTCIDRATLGSTRIRRGVKLDNLIQVAHNVDIGENTVIAALSGVAGSARIGKNCMIGGQVGIVGHITVAEDVKIGAQAGIEGNVKQRGAILLGSPAIDIANFRRSHVHFKHLQQLANRVSELEKRLQELTGGADAE